MKANEKIRINSQPIDKTISVPFLLNKDISEIDPDVDMIIKLEEERQTKKIILIASESICPNAVRQALGSVFTNIYAEGYPPLRMTRDEQNLLLDFKYQLAYHRRYADRRYYKGCDYVNFIEALAIKRCAQLFATRDFPPEKIFVNVQPLSGAAANNAVYEAFLKPGDTVMGMALHTGGHLTHGNKANRSGKCFNIVSYTADRHTGKLNYEKIKELAIKYKPKMIIAGYSAYPWSINWQKFREIADAVPGKAILLADIAHPAGLVIAGVFPNPVGFADVISFTTHKTLCGPRGAVIITTDEEKAKKIDAAVFPGEQGGPHINNIAAKAVAFKIASSPQFKELQKTIVDNARYLGQALEDCGLKLAYGGTDTHLLLIDLKALSPAGQSSQNILKGEIASRILDLCGITCNKNTIQDDDNAAHPTAIRLGTTWVTQMGMGKKEMEKLAYIISTVLKNIRPFSYNYVTGVIGKGKIEIEIIEQAKKEVAQILEDFSDSQSEKAGHCLKSAYPHYYSFSTEKVIRHTPLLKHLPSSSTCSLPLYFQDKNKELEALHSSIGVMDLGDLGILQIWAERATAFLQEVCTSNLCQLKANQGQYSLLLNKKGEIIDDISILRFPSHEIKGQKFMLVTNPENSEKVKNWLRYLSDGYINFDDQDIYAKIEGPVIVEDMKDPDEQKNPFSAIAFQGAKAPKLLARIAPSLKELKYMHFQETEIEGIKVILFRSGYRQEDNRFELYADQDNIYQLWNIILEAGKDLNIMPCGLLARNAYRKEAGLPLYSEELTKSLKDITITDNSVLKNMISINKLYFIGQNTIYSWLQPEKGKEKFIFIPPSSPPKRSCLYQEHVKLSAKIVLFAGWEMPVWYTSTGEEHQAVRETTALFDVSHMGILEIRGRQASRFLDAVSTNYVANLKPGDSLYSYILNPDGQVMDDVMIYCLTPEKYMMIVNAVNNDKIKAWLEAVNSRRYIIDYEIPLREIEEEVEIRDLKEEKWGSERKVNLALQGPNSRLLLNKIASTPEIKQKLKSLARSKFIHVRLDGIPTMVSRTGYTGEEIGYELYIHPDDAPHMWNLLLREGEEFGIKPAGLGARDSTRTEAGLPLYGHELAGVYDITPGEAGYGGFVRLHKPFFIGRRAYIKKEIEKCTGMAIARFQMKEKGIRMIQPGDPIVNKKGECIGWVTSCVLIENLQMGMAYINKRFNIEGTPIAIFILPRGKTALLEKPKELLKPGEKVILHAEGTILPRFPVKNSRRKDNS